MKKLFFVAGVMAALSGLTAFGQGNFIFNSAGRYVWNTGPANPVPGGPYNVAFLWSTNLGATPLVAQETGLSHTPTNYSSSLYLYGLQAFNNILTDPNFQLGRATFLGDAVAVATLTAVGGISYNGGGPFGVSGTSTNGGSVLVFFIAWSNLYSDPALAAAVFPLVGWSNPFLYNYANTTSTPAGMGSQAAADGVDARFGLGIPEPSAFALAGLGAIAMLIFRRQRAARRSIQKPCARF